ncbi:hypothetical protein [Ferrimonas marina]|nr:hypothetical protein [Ferrimonas marina]
MAAAIGVSRSQLSRWANFEDMPDDRADQLLALVSGELTFDEAVMGPHLAQWQLVEEELKQRKTFMSYLDERHSYEGGSLKGDKGMKALRKACIEMMVACGAKFPADKGDERLPKLVEAISYSYIVTSRLLTITAEYAPICTKAETEAVAKLLQITPNLAAMSIENAVLEELGASSEAIQEGQITVFNDFNHLTTELMQALLTGCGVLAFDFERLWHEDIPTLSNEVEEEYSRMGEGWNYESFSNKAIKSQNEEILAKLESIEAKLAS